MTPAFSIGRLSVAVGSSNSFDLIVVGGGTGGYAAAFRAGQLGLKVALIDDRARLGGTCLHIGCIPTKAMLESAEFYERLHHAADFGINVSDVSFDYAVAAKRRDGVVDRLTKGLDSLVKKNKVEHIRGWGTLQGGKKVLVKTLNENGEPDGERPLDATDVILASGSRVKSLPGLVPDGKTIITSDDATTGNTLPKSIVVVGGGAVGVEFASFYHDVGVEVTLLEYLPRLTPLEDAGRVQGAAALVPAPRHEGHRQRAVRHWRGGGERAGRVLHGRRGRGGAQGGARRADARRYRSGACDRGCRPRVDARQDRKGFRDGRPTDAHRRAAPVRLW